MPVAAIVTMWVISCPSASVPSSRVDFQNQQVDVRIEGELTADSIPEAVTSASIVPTTVRRGRSCPRGRGTKESRRTRSNTGGHANPGGAAGDATRPVDQGLDDRLLVDSSSVESGLFFVMSNDVEASQ